MRATTTNHNPSDKNLHTPPPSYQWERTSCCVLSLSRDPSVQSLMMALAVSWWSVQTRESPSGTCVSGNLSASSLPQHIQSHFQPMKPGMSLKPRKVFLHKLLTRKTFNSLVSCLKVHNTHRTLCDCSMIASQMHHKSPQHTQKKAESMRERISGPTNPKTSVPTPRLSVDWE